MLRFGSNSLALILACQMAAGLTQSAWATEQLVLPFTCEADPTGVYATPSDLQAFPILGKRDAAPFTACDPRDPNRCRTIMLHRFELDCGGTRVAWPEFYAAISGITTGRAVYEANRLMVRVRPQPNRRFRGRDLRGGTRLRSFVIEMPEGYAPVRGTVARFVDQNGRRVAAPGAPITPAQSKTIAGTRKPIPSEAKRVAPAHSKPPGASKNQVKVSKPDRTAAKATGADQTKSTKKDKPGIAVHSVPKAKPSPYKASNAIKSPPRVVPKILNAERRTSDASKVDSPSKTEPKKPAEARLTTIDPRNAKQKTKLTFGENLTKSAPKAKKPDVPAAQGGTIKEGNIATSDPDTRTSEASEKAAPSHATRAQSPPSLFDTLAVLVVVAGLMLTLLFAGPRLLRRSKHAPVHADYETARDHAKALALAADQLKQPNLEDGNTPSKPNVAKKEDRPDFRVLTVDVKQDLPPAHEKPHVEPQLPGLKNIEKTEHKLTEAQVRGDTHESLSNTQALTPADPDLPVPIPQPKQQPLFEFAKPDTADTALILPTTRQEALTALGVGSNAGQDVIARVVQDLKTSCRLEDAEDSYDKLNRQNRMEQIEAAWKILAGSSQARSTTKNERTDQHA